MFEAHGDYVFGVLLVPVAVLEEDRLFYQEVDFVLTPEVVLTVRKTPPGEEPFSIAPVQEACDAHGSPSAGLVVYLVDEVAERLGYAFSWAVIAGTTIGQLVFFRWKRWI